MARLLLLSVQLNSCYADDLLVLEQQAQMAQVGLWADAPPFRAQEEPSAGSAAQAAVTTPPLAVPARTQPVLAPTATPPSAAAQAAVGVQIVSISSPARRGSDATRDPQTVPSAQCNITVVYLSGPSRAAGLYPRQADGDGAVSWTWRVGTNTTPGEWPITLTCNAGGQQWTARTIFVVG